MDMQKIEDAFNTLREGFKITVFADWTGKGLAHTNPEVDKVRAMRVGSYEEALRASAWAYANGATEVKAVITIPNPEVAYNKLVDAFKSVHPGSPDASPAGSMPANDGPSPSGDSRVTPITACRRRVH